MTIVRRHETAEGRREAVYSDCGRYRYALSVAWGAGPVLAYAMLNPSTATELANDPTIERCERRARRLGYGGFRVVNLFALRETSPARLKAAAEPEGIDNIEFIMDVARRSDAVLAAWGVHGAHLGQGDRVARMLRHCERPLLCLGVTKAGHPRHPLYVSYDTAPVAW